MGVAVHGRQAREGRESCPGPGVGLHEEGFVRLEVGHSDLVVEKLEKEGKNLNKGNENAVAAPVELKLRVVQHFIK